MPIDAVSMSVVSGNAHHTAIYRPVPIAVSEMRRLSHGGGEWRWSRNE